GVFGGRPWPLAATAEMAASVSSKLSAVNPASAASKFCALAASEPHRRRLSATTSAIKRSHQTDIAVIPGKQREAAGRRLPTLSDPEGRRHPPHRLVFVFQLPHLWVTQSPTKSREPSSSFDQASPATSPGVFHTTSNWPSARTSPIKTGFVMWWFGSISEMPPVRFGA